MFEYDPLCRINLIKTLSGMEASVVNLRPLADRSLLVRMWLIQFDDTP